MGILTALPKLVDRGTDEVCSFIAEHALPLDDGGSAPADKEGEDPAAPDELLRYLCFSATRLRARCDDAAPANDGAPCSREEDCGGVKGTTAWCVAQDKRDVLEHVHLSNQFGDGLVSVKDQARERVDWGAN